MTPFEQYLQSSQQLNDSVKHGRLPLAAQGPDFAVSTVRYQRKPPLVSVVASTGVPIRAAEIAAWYKPLFAELNQLSAAGVKTNHPCVYFYGQRQGDAFVLQAGFPVPHVPQPLPGQLIERTDPAGWCASVVLIGDFMKHIGQAWDAALTDVKRLGLPRTGEDREIYHHMTDFICTEVQIGLADTPAVRARSDGS